MEVGQQVVLHHKVLDSSSIFEVYETVRVMRIRGVGIYDKIIPDHHVFANTAIIALQEVYSCISSEFNGVVVDVYVVKISLVCINNCSGVDPRNAIKNVVVNAPVFFRMRPVRDS